MRKTKEVSRKTNRSQRRWRITPQKMMILCGFTFLLGVLCGKVVFAKAEPEEISVSKIIRTQENESKEGRININQGRLNQEDEPEQDWKLVLVNSTHFMEKGYVPELEEIENNYYFDARAVEDLRAMLKAGRAEGMDFWICSAYRTMEKQTSLYENKVRRLMTEMGLDYEKAYEQAGNTVAFPGTSEHQLGLAVDIVVRIISCWMRNRQILTRQSG